MLMLQGWREEVGDLLALLRCSIVNSAANAPRGGVKFDQMHPYPSIATQRRRQQLAESGADNWALFDAAMERYTKG